MRVASKCFQNHKLLALQINVQSFMVTLSSSYNSSWETRAVSVLEQNCRGRKKKKLLTRKWEQERNVLSRIFAPCVYTINHLKSESILMVSTSASLKLKEREGGKKRVFQIRPMQSPERICALYGWANTSALIQGRMYMSLRAFNSLVVIFGRDDI